MTNRQRERGATLVTTALFATALTMVTGLVVDTGAMLYQRTRMQVATDAAALAGARALLNGQAYAVAEAKSEASKNGYAVRDSDITIQQGSRISVRLQNQTPSLAARVLNAVRGLDPQAAATLGVEAKSTADLHCVELTYGVRPFGIPDRAFRMGAEYVLKQSAGGSTDGNFQALALDGPGASLYRTAILNGAKRTVHVGDSVPTEPGNMAGPTVVAINQLLGNDHTSFVSASYGSRTPRVITVPLIDANQYAQANGRSDVTVTGFGRFYVTYTTSRSEVYGRFMERVNQQTVQGTALQYSVRLADEGDPVPPPVTPGSSR